MTSRPSLPCRSVAGRVLVDLPASSGPHGDPRGSHYAARCVKILVSSCAAALELGCGDLSTAQHHECILRRGSQHAAAATRIIPLGVQKKCNTAGYRPRLCSSSSPPTRAASLGRPWLRDGGAAAGNKRGWSAATRLSRRAPSDGIRQILPAGSRGARPVPFDRPTICRAIIRKPRK